MSDSENIQSVNVLGVKVSVTDMVTAVSRIERWVGQDAKKYLCVTGVHGVMESQKDPALMDIHNRSGMTLPDGMPMVWTGRFYGFKNMGRVYGPDFMLNVCRNSFKNNFSHFLYGGNDGVVEKLRANLEKKFPGILIKGTYTPPFRPLNKKEQVDLIEQVAECSPDIFWVGLSTPKQERFMAQYLPQLETKVMIGVGAAFDIHAGLLADPPEWVKGSGMQWFYRLCQDPQRLWRRYLTNNPVFMYKILQQIYQDKIIRGKSL